MKMTIEIDEIAPGMLKTTYKGRGACTPLEQSCVELVVLRLRDALSEWESKQSKHTKVLKDTFRMVTRGGK